MNEFVIFGSTGDLATRKILPALELLDKPMKIIAVGRRNYTTKDYIRFISEHKTYKEEFLKRIQYVEADISGDISKINDMLKDPIFFFATAPEFYENIVKQLDHEEAKAIFEKPFGEDEKSARHLNEIIRHKFKEIYRIDHYLGKETVQNIMILRFANSFLEPIWNSKYIESIQIIIDENEGIGTRGQYYDRTGAIKDMLQNHILQMISLLMMDTPKSISPEDIHEAKLHILKKIRIKDIITGQYEGYGREQYVKKDSETETFLAAILEIDENRYRDIPVFVMTGKKMKDKRARIIVTFKEDNHKLFRNLEQNTLTLNISPIQDITLDFNTKRAGVDFNIAKAKLDFCHKCAFKENSSQGYEKLISDILIGDNTLFITEDELIESWKIIDRIRKEKPRIYKESTIPEYAVHLAAKYGIKNANL